MPKIPHSPPASAQPFTAALPAIALYAAGLAGPPLASQFFPPAVSSLFPLQWPPVPVAEASVRLPPLATQTYTSQSFPPFASYASLNLNRGPSFSPL